MGKHKRIFQRFLLVSGLALFALFTARAAFAQNVTQGYKADQTLQQGMIVRLKPSDGSKVEALTQTDESDMLGVVVSSDDTPVSLSETNDSKQTFVATYGKYPVLVSNQNGPVKTGDLVTISSLGGVGMKANTTQEMVIGKALSGFDGTNNVVSSTTLDTSNGKQNVTLGRITVDISVAHNPQFATEKVAGVPEVLGKVAKAITNRPVSAVRIYASLGVLMLSLVIAGSILYAGVRSGMTAVGRNPLAKHSIARNLIQVTLMSLIVFVIGVIAVYLLLRI
jgi:hypothetical protein